MRGAPASGVLGIVPPRSTACEELVGGVSRRIEARVDVISRQLTDRAVAEIPELQVDGMYDEVLAMAAGSVALITAMTRQWTDPHVVPPPHEALEWARGLVARGLPIDVILRVYRNGQSGYHDAWHQELAASGAPPEVVLEALHACSAFFFTWVEAITMPLVRAYHDEYERRMRGAEAVRLETVRAILDGEDVDPLLAGARLGYDIHRPHLAFVAWTERHAPEADAAREEAVAQLVRAVGASAERILQLELTARATSGWIPRPQLDEAAIERLREALRGCTARLALGSTGSGIAGFRRSHDQAQRARRVAHVLRRTAALTRFEDVAIADLLTRDIEAARDVARATLGPLTGRDDATRRLLTTLRVFLEEGQSFARTGRRLGVHQNTIAYRVRRAIELTGQEGPGSQALWAAVTLAPLLDEDDDARR